jgi:hypothetical protein
LCRDSQMSESVAELRKRVKELRGAIVGSVSSAGVEELKKEIAYHEAAAKSAERDKKRMEALAKAREAKIAKGKAKKEGVAEAKPIVKPVVEKKAEPVKRKTAKPAEGEPKPKKAKVAPAPEEVVLAKNIRAKKVKNASSEDDE